MIMIMKLIIFDNYFNYNIYSPKKEKETQHVKKYNLHQIFNIILNTEINITLH